ncbi:unnamed protein product, partial [Musa textilis]
HHRLLALLLLHKLTALLCGASICFRNLQHHHIFVRSHCMIALQGIKGLRECQDR